MGVWKPVIKRAALLTILVGLLPGVGGLLYGTREHTASGVPSNALSVSGVVVEEPVIDLGVVWSGQSIERKFKLTNQSGNDVRILSTLSDCSCTVASLPTEMLRGGASLEIPFTFWPHEPSGDHDRFERAILVTFESKSTTHVLPLRFIGSVASDRSFQLFPVTIDNLALRPEHSIITQVHVKAASNILDSLPSQIDVKAGATKLIVVRTLTPQTPIAEKDINVRIISGAATDTGRFDSQIIFTPNPKSAGLSLRLRGEFIPEISVDRRAFIISGDVDEAVIQFTNNYSTILPIPSIETSLPLEWDFIGPPGPRLRMRVRLKSVPVHDESGTLDAVFSTAGATSVQRLSINVVILDRLKGNYTGQNSGVGPHH